VSPDRVTDLVPFVHVGSVADSVAFYERLGFEINSTFEPDGELAWAFLQRAHARIMLARADAPIDPERQGVLFWLYTQDLDGFHARLREQGLEPGPIVDGTPGPPREFGLTDPDGYELMVSEVEGDRVDAA